MNLYTNLELIQGARDDLQYALNLFTGEAIPKDIRTYAGYLFKQQTTGNYYYLRADDNRGLYNVTSTQQSNVNYIPSLLGSLGSFNIMDKNCEVNTLAIASSVSPNHFYIQNIAASSKGATGALINTVDLSMMNMSNVTSLSLTFAGLSAITIDATSINWNNVTSINNLFYGDYRLTTVYGLENLKLENTAINSLSSVFDGCSNMNLSFLNNWNTKNITSMQNIFAHINDANIFNYISKWDFSNVNSINGMFAYGNISHIDCNLNLNPSKNIVIDRLFAGSDGLHSLNLGVLANHKNITSVGELFWTTNNLTTVTGLSNFIANLSSCNNFARLFCYTGISNVADAAQNIKFNTSLNTNAYALLAGSNFNNIDLTKWNVINVYSLSDLFANCQKLTKANLANWDCKIFVYLTSLFDNCFNLTEVNMSGWKCEPNSITNMFSNCRKLTTLDLSGQWVFAFLESYSNVFQNCVNLVNLKCNWTLPNITANNMGTNIFLYCNNLSMDSFNSIANMLPPYDATYCNNNNNLSYFGINQANSKVNANLSSYFRTTMNAKGWNI